MRILRFFLRALLYLVLTVVILFVLCMVFPPATAVTFGVLNGAVYHKAGTVVLHYREKEITVPVYKSRGKPFLLVGPHEFYYSVCFQGKPFNITVIQVYAPTSNAEEAEVEWFYEPRQHPQSP